MGSELAVIEVEQMVEHPHRCDSTLVILRGEKQRCTVEVHEVDLEAPQQHGHHLAIGVACPIRPGPPHPFGGNAPVAAVVALVRLEGRKLHQLLVTQPQAGSGEKVAEIDGAAVGSVEGRSDTNGIAVLAANSEGRVVRGQVQVVVPDAQLLGCDSESLEEPVGDDHLGPADLEGGTPIEKANLVREGALDVLAAVGPLGCQLIAFGVEITVDDSEVDDALVGREKGVGTHHQRAEMRLEFVRLQGREVHLFEVGIGVDQGGVVLTVISDQKDPAHGLEVPKEVFDLLRGDRLAAGVLVDLLLAIDDPDEPVIVHLHQIAGVEPALGVE